MNLEYRALQEIESISDDKPRLIGYAALFNSETTIGAGRRNPIREMILPGAFQRTLTESPDVRALLNHDTNKVLGRAKAGTLTVTEDTRGLRVEINPPNNSLGWDVLESVRRGDLDAMSFGFTVRSESWDRTGNKPLRILQDVTLFEVSIATFPAYQDTEIAVRSLIADETAMDQERLTRLRIAAAKG